MLLHLSQCSELTLHEQVARELAGRFLRGDLPPGTALAPARVLARSNRIRPGTVRRAYDRLFEAGLVEPTATGLAFVSRLAPPARAAAARRLELDEAATAPGEIEAARQIQVRLLPGDLPRGPDAWVAVGAASAGALAGDFHDCIAIDGDRLVLVVGDACGKGLPAALLASQLQSWLKSELRQEEDPAAVLGRLNRSLAEHMPNNRYVALSCCLYTRSTGALVHAAAGHAGPLRIDRRGMGRRLEAAGPPLGLLEEGRYASGRSRLCDGELLVLYTDGVTETTGPDGEEYGADRLARWLAEHRELAPPELIARTFARLDRLSGGRPPHDDRTLMILRRGAVEPRRAARDTSEDRPCCWT